MSDTLTLKQARFCSEYTKDCNGTQAAIRAGYSPRTANEQASQMLKKPAVSAAIAELQAAIADANSITVNSLLVEAEEARRVGRANDNASAMVGATTLKAKLCGLLIEKTEDMTKREAMERLGAERRELRTAGTMLADAAESLGLSRTASPAEIVGAISQRELATPEAFALLHAAQTALTDEAL